MQRFSTLTACVIASLLGFVAAACGADRHVYVIYDVSLSYQFNHKIGWDDDRDAILDAIKRVGGAITDTDFFSFLPMDGSVRYDCDMARLGKDYAHGAELFGATVDVQDGHDGQLSTGSMDWNSAWSAHIEKFRANARTFKLTDWTKNTDLVGALYRASYMFRKYPARKNYLLIFSDLDDDPLDPGSLRGLCGTLDLRNVEVHVVDFGDKLSKYVKNPRTRPSASMRLANFSSLMQRAHAAPFKQDTHEEIFDRLGVDD